MRGYRIVPVVINPVRYNSGSHELEVVDNCDIELNYNTNLNRVNLVQKFLYTTTLSFGRTSAAPSGRQSASRGAETRPA